MLICFEKGSIRIESEYNLGDRNVSSKSLDELSRIGFKDCFEVELIWLNAAIRHRQLNAIPGLKFVRTKVGEGDERKKEWSG